MSFQKWLKDNKERPISNLTDAEIERYADYYASARVAEFKSLVESSLNCPLCDSDLTEKDDIDEDSR